MSDDRKLAMFMDFENIVRGVKEAQYKGFEIKLVLERLVEKGKIMVRRAYADWNRYAEYKRPFHEQAIELIDVPQSRYSGKNSADIRMVVDALDLCYTKDHIDTFVIISGDSDFSPLVSKLRENAKTVIGVGVKNSTSDLLMSNCDEFILYDDLARKAEPPKRRRQPKAEKAPKAEKSPKAEKAPKAEETTPSLFDDKAQKAIDLVRETVEALFAERGDSAKLWGSMVKQTLKRRQPSFDESYYGFRSFNDLLEEAQSRGHLKIEMDEKSGGYVIRSVTRQA